MRWLCLDMGHIQNKSFYIYIRKNHNETLDFLGLCVSEKQHVQLSVNQTNLFSC